MSDKLYTQQELNTIGNDIIAIMQIRDIADMYGQAFSIASIAGSHGAADEDTLKEEKRNIQRTALEKLVQKYDGAIVRLEGLREQVPELVSKLLDPIYKVLPQLKPSPKNPQQ